MLTFARGALLASELVPPRNRGVARAAFVRHVLRDATNGTCVTVQDWRNGVCKASPVVVDIPFSIAGDFVYHCHILEHEDGGMMARIRVRASPQA